jgi:formyl-CoA transferase
MCTEYDQDKAFNDFIRSSIYSYLTFLKSPSKPMTALSKFKVLDLTRARAGPTCVKQFADFGADVIKIEMSPGMGDASQFSGARHGPDMQNLHRNKRSLTLDLKQQDGLEIFYQLVKTADVLVENFRPDVKNRLRIDYETLKGINPRIILVSISGFRARWALRETSDV